MDEFVNVQGAGSIQEMKLDDVSPATRLLEKRRQMFEVQEALETQKEEFARREELFKRREEQLRKQDLELQQQLIRFNKFLQENDSKTARAEKKAAEEIKLREQKEKEIQELSQQLLDFTAKKDEMKAMLDKKLVYEKYLLSVLDETDDFAEIKHLVDRHETLKVHHKDLQDKAAQVVLEMDEYRKEMMKYTKEGQNNKLGGHNKIATRQKTLETNQLESQTAGSKREEILEESSSRVNRYGTARMAISNLYERCRRTGKLKQAPTSDPFQQLRVLQDFMADVQVIVSKANKPSTQKTEGAKTV